MPPDPVGAPEEDSDEARLEWLDKIIGKYLLKVRQEREARLAGEVVAADFYVRQLTHLEVMLDLGSGDGFSALMDFRLKGRHLIAIAETPMSKLLGEARRQKWAEIGEPPRPEHPPRRYLEDHPKRHDERLCGMLHLTAFPLFKKSHLPHNKASPHNYGARWGIYVCFHRFPGAQRRRASGSAASSGDRLFRRPGG